MSIVFALERTNQLSLLPDKDLVDLCPPIEPYQVTKNRYPTDLNLLNQGRKQTEKIIDILYETLKGKLVQKPRTYRLLARKSYLEVAKKRKPPVKQRR